MPALASVRVALPVVEPGRHPKTFTLGDIAQSSFKVRNSNHAFPDPRL
jgi:hypothetical protein